MEFENLVTIDNDIVALKDIIRIELIPKYNENLAEFVLRYMYTYGEYEGHDEKMPILVYKIHLKNDTSIIVQHYYNINAVIMKKIARLYFSDRECLQEISNKELTEKIGLNYNVLKLNINNALLKAKGEYSTLLTKWDRCRSNSKALLTL